MNIKKAILMGVVSLTTLACSCLPFTFSLSPRSTSTPWPSPTPPAAPTQSSLPAATETPYTPSLPPTSFESVEYVDPQGLFSLRYPKGWQVKVAENGTTSFCQTAQPDSPCLAVQIREDVGDVQAFADETLVGLESTVSDYYAGTPFKSTTGDNWPIISVYVEYTYQGVAWAGNLAFVVKKNGQGYYISAVAQGAEQYREVEGLFTEILLGMRFGE